MQVSAEEIKQSAADPRNKAVSPSSHSLRPPTSAGSRNFCFSTSGRTSAASPHHRTLLVHARDDVSDIVPRETWLSQHSRGLAHELEKRRAVVHYGTVTVRAETGMEAIFVRD